MIYIVAENSRMAQAIAEANGLSNAIGGFKPKWRYVYAPYMLQGLRKPKVWLSAEWGGGKNEEEYSGFKHAFASLQARLTNVPDSLIVKGFYEGQEDADAEERDDAE